MDGKQNQTGSELCNIRIVFQPDTDEEAIAYKKKIKEVFADKPEARIVFGLMAMPEHKHNDSI